MSQKIKENKLFKNWFKNLQEKRRVVVLDFDSYEEKRNYITSKFSLFILLSFFSIIAFMLIFLLISYTSLKTFIPGYPNPLEQKALIDKNINLDQKLADLLIKTEKEEKYINNVQQILNGTMPSYEKDSGLKNFKTVKANEQDVVSISEKSLREKVNNREKYDLDVIPGGALKSEVLPELLLFPPIIGEITNGMNISEGHFGIDVIAPKNEAVVSILKGTVIYQNWSPTDGHVIHIQHKKNLLSIYKHNSEVLKKYW
jgi:murein DD-endopeptidase MepM/ murein hydrolase activator NlpD